MRINEDIGDWVVIGSEPGARELAFQRVGQYSPPDWPDPHRPQQLHLDIRVDEVDTAERQVLALGRDGCQENSKAATGSSPIRPAASSAWCSDDTAHRRCIRCQRGE
jgi:hypothetical protein